MGRLLEQRPHESNALQGFAETHLIGHDTAVLVLHDHSSRAFVEKL